MNCRSAEPLFSSFIEDEISQEERRALESHLMQCRRCSLSLRELRATLSVLTDLPQAATSAHFEEDLMARIRSGEGLRPSVGDWFRELLAPARLRPVFMAGAGVCAVWIAIMVSPFGKQQAPVTSNPSLAAGAPRVVATAPSPSNPVPASTQTKVLGQTASSARGSAPVMASALPARASRQNAAAQDSILDAPPQDQRYLDEIINDQFYLERGREGQTQDPAIVPVNDTGSDGVYITF